MGLNALTVISRIRPEKLEHLRTLLVEIGNDIRDNIFVRFPELSGTHFARWVIVDNDTGFPPLLVFESNFDGEFGEFIEEMVTKAGSGLDAIYGHCQDYPTEGTSNLRRFEAYFKARSFKYNTFYAAYRGVTLKDVRNNTKIREKIEGFLDLEKACDPLSKVGALEIHKKIQDFLDKEKTRESGLSTEPYKNRSFLRAAKLFILVIIGILAILVFLPLIIVWAILLRIHESRDVPASEDAVQVDKETIEKLVEKEDIAATVQNQLTTIVNIKPGKFRLITLKVVLWVINLLAKYHSNQGSLGGIPTIHFARWIIIDNKRLLFLSNYDGSWENYLGDFIDKASTGLTAIWSNTVGFPRTTFLVRGGADNEELFKRWARTTQIPTQVWYSAHPGETVKDILNNIKIRDKIERPLNERESEQWLKLL